MPKKMLSDQLKDVANTIAAKQQRQTEIMDAAAAEGRSTTAEEATEFDEIGTELKTLSADHERLKMLDANTKTQLRAVEGDDSEAASRSRGGSGKGLPVMSARELPKGTRLTRYAMALARCKGNVFEAAEFAKQWDDSTPDVSRVLKAAVSAGTTTDANWASQLVFYQNMVDEFVDLLRPMTILGKFGVGGIPSLRRVPFNIRMANQTGGGVYGWVGQGAAKPAGQLTIGEITLKWAKAAGIIVVTDELMRFSTPTVESVVRNDMLKGMAAFSDLQFINPDVGDVVDVSPASITNGATNHAATGTDAAALRADLATLWDTFFAANQPVTTGVFIMSNRQAMRIALMRNALGQKEYPDVTPQGGILEGFPIIASESVPDDSNGGVIAFVNADDIYFADDGPITIDASREASLQMSTTPDEPTTASTVLVSLWQRNLIGLRAERYMNWKRRRSSAVAYITGTNYHGG